MTPETFAAEHPNLVKYVDRQVSTVREHLDRVGAVLERAARGARNGERMTSPDERPSPLPWLEGVAGGLHSQSHGEAIATLYTCRANRALILAAVNALHAIAPGREIEAAKALPKVKEYLRMIARGAEAPDVLATMALEQLTGAPLPLSRDLYTNASRLRSRMRAFAEKWRGNAACAERQERGEIEASADPSGLPGSVACAALANTADDFADELDRILMHEETVTTQETDRRRGVPGA